MLKWIALNIHHGKSDTFLCPRCEVTVELKEPVVSCDYNFCPYCSAEMSETDDEDQAYNMEGENYEFDSLEY